jgi:hypothetical protein
MRKITIHDLGYELEQTKKRTGLKLILRYDCGKWTLWIKPYHTIAFLLTTNEMFHLLQGISNLKQLEKMENE